ncbi:MAG: DUF1801 domain-containing protein [Lewinellaceae bacterium]|nr:DUF1801 domain-containing protein [Lewinellaceae bacterium]
MAELKTTPNDANVQAFLDGVEDEKKRQDAYAILELMKEVSGEPPKMWGPSIVGFGAYHYKYDSGREGDWFLTGFSPRKQNLTLYIMAGFSRYDDLMGRLGKYKTGKSCLYIKKLEDVDQGVLKELVEESVGYMRARYG